jgi:hypothetical protein
VAEKLAALFSTPAQRARRSILSAAALTFNERAPRLRTGYQVQCPNCMKLITFDNSSEDPNIRRPLKSARDIRIAAEEAIVLARIAAQGAKRDPVF